MTRPLSVLTVLLAATLTACSGVSSGSGNTNLGPPNTPDTIAGTVTFKGTPMNGAAITDFLTNSNAIFATAITNATGNYSFSGMQTTGNVPGEYQVWAMKDGYGFYPSVGSGAKVTRADYTGQFVQTGVLAYAIYFTVIDYVALPHSPLKGANFAAYDGTNPPATLPSTGQQTSYAIGDDASLKKGVSWSAATRFTDNNDGTVTDGLTGLIWLKNAGCFPAANWSTALTEVNQLASGACGLSDNSTAGQWRLPNINELESMVDVSASNPAVSTLTPFQNVSSAIYWSSTSYFGGQEGSPHAWAIRFSDGRFMNDLTSNVKTTASNMVWAVKGSGGGAIKLQSTGEYVVFAAGDDGSFQEGVPPTYPRWLDRGDGTIIDLVTGLIWLKKADCINETWPNALIAVNNLASDQCGLTDHSTPGQWRMPNRNEMQSLSDRMETNLAAFFDTTFLNPDNSVYQAPIFINFIEQQYYWTSTTNAANPSEAWTVYSCDFGVYDIGKSQSGYTLAVRNLTN
jgi:hypothetical protein